MIASPRDHRAEAVLTAAWWLALAVAAMLVGLKPEPARAFLARPILFLGVTSAAPAPPGWTRFCAEQPTDCKPVPGAAERVLTPDLLAELFAVNAEVNTRVRWTSDRELYGEDERWTYPLDRGDCEDFVLLKRRLLIAAGWPAGALLITVVHDPAPAPGSGDGTHAVLTVRTDRGDLVLDNQTPEVLFWHETAYRFVKRQTSEDPNVWVALTDSRAPTLAAHTPYPLPPKLDLASR
ncbi:transglutaminase-like cysteine peptidase [Rhodoplanes azumiensis]|uniref:Transglutaminase-like cysteine peptidase n=1 Tax=Rhodoplanes azumiensis TaxID=1897628 RepID=A0ABW5ALX1_9BRAD